MSFGERVILDSRPCWCGASRWQVIFRTPRAGLVQCPSCGTYRTDPPPPVEGPEESAEFYSRYYSNLHGLQEDPDPSPARGSRFWSVAERYPPLTVPGSSATDIGCGEGGLCRELDSLGWTHVTGIDISRTRIERAKVRYPEMRFFDVPIGETGTPPGSQDLIVMDNVIEHLPDPLEFLRGIRNFLSPDGLLVLITPNMSSGQFKLLGRRWTPELAPHVHIYLFVSDSLAALTEKAGYLVVARGDFQGPHYTPGDLWRSCTREGAKGILFSAAMEAGGIWARVIREGPMVYVVVKPRLSHGDEQ